MKRLTQQEYQALLRQDYSTFLHRAFMELHPQGCYRYNWHLDLMADRLMGVADARIRRLIFTVPPRSLKSIATTVAFPAWLLGRDPRKRIICASYGQELADKHARDTRQLMQPTWYRDTFRTRLTGDRPAFADFQTTAQGGRMATSVGGVLTGRGGDILIIDDPIKPDEALSKSQRDRVNDWYDSTLYSRLNDKQAGAIIIVMQRVHLDDLVGHVCAREDWEIINLPAIATEDTVWKYRTLSGVVTKTRRAGEVLQPDREPLSVLQAIRENLGEYSFSAQYQQAPVPFGGGIVKREWLQYLPPDSVPGSFDTIVQSWDTANKANELADFSVCSTWGVKNKKCYLLNVYRKRLNYPDLKRAVHEQAKLFAPTIILVEDRASGTQLIQELMQERLYQIKAVKPEGDKIMRMHAQTAVIENGFVFLPTSAAWLDEYVNELTCFPYARHDDQVDSTAQALQWISAASAEPGIITYYRQLYESQNRK